MSKFCRLIRFDKRGTGLSDRPVHMATLEERTDDIRAVMDDVGIKSANIHGVSEGGSMACLFAATYLEGWQRQRLGSRLSQLPRLAGTPGNGKWEINLPIAFEHRPGEWALDAPGLDLNYGLGDRIQLTLQTAVALLSAAIGD